MDLNHAYLVIWFILTEMIFRYIQMHLTLAILQVFLSSPSTHDVKAYMHLAIILVKLSKL